MNVNPSLSNSLLATRTNEREKELTTSLLNRPGTIKMWLAGISLEEKDIYFNSFEFHPDGGRTLKPDVIAKKKLEMGSSYKSILDLKFTQDDVDLSTETYTHNSTNKSFSVKEIKEDTNVSPVLKAVIIKEYNSLFDK